MIACPSLQMEYIHLCGFSSNLIPILKVPSDHFTQTLWRASGRILKELLAFILRHEALLHVRGDLCDVIQSCVLLHNLIVEDERSLEDPMGAGVSFLEEDVKEPGVFSRVPQQYVTNNISFPLHKLIEHYHHLYDHNAHETLKYDLMCRIWAHRDAIITSVKKDSLQ